MATDIAFKGNEKNKAHPQINSLQEAQKRIEEIEDKISNLEDEIRDLKDDEDE